MKKIIFQLLITFIFVPSIVNASNGSAARVGNKFYYSLEEAILNASSNDTIMLISDTVLDDTLNINKTVNLNLNGHDITAPSMVFKVNGGVLNLSGSGIIRETKPNYGAVAVIGSNDSTDNNYSIVNVGKNIKLEGWSGIFITHDNNKSYGVVVNLEGDINAVNDVSGDTGIGVYVNGNIKDNNNAPVVNIGDDAEINSTGNGLYIAGYSTFNIGNAYIEGIESGIAIKSGKLNIDGASVVSYGEDKTPTEGYNNGVKASGTSIQIESNNGYFGQIEIDITDGTFLSKNSYTIYEYIGKGTKTIVDSISISGGTFVSNKNKPVFGLSNSFKNIHTNFITGGEYSSDPTNYLKPGYTSVLDDGIYIVTSSSAKLVSGDNINTSDSNGLLKIITTIVVIGSAILLGYMNRDKILNLFRK